MTQGTVATGGLTASAALGHVWWEGSDPAARLITAITQRLIFTKRLLCVLPDAGLLLCSLTLGGRHRSDTVVTYVWELGPHTSNF